ncbi:MAG: sugar phosphate isomerase/epimerase, partial [Chloroflexi bacterium]|nr:sugar phosphate isomerase/epimerase [Chloroflexota bacterium]
MLDPKDNIIAASPNCFLEFSPWVAYHHFPQVGIHHVEIPAQRNAGAFVPEIMDDADVQQLKDRLAGLGVTPVSVGAYCDLLHPRQVDLLRRRIDFAQQLGAQNVVSDATRRLEVDADQWRKLGNTLRHVGDYAADRGVRIALETHGGLTRNGALARKLLDAVDHPAIGINYDTGNIYYYNDDLDPAEDVRQVAERVVQVHLKDTVGGKGEWMFCALGDGRVNFPAIIAELQSVGFHGPYSLELEGQRGQDLNREGHLGVIRKSLEYLRRIGLMGG